MDSQSRFLYVTDSVLNVVWAYTIGANGGLRAIAGSPFATGNYPFALALDPTDSYLYVVNDGAGANNISGYSIGTDGSLTPLTSSPFATGNGPSWITITP